MSTPDSANPTNVPNERNPTNAPDSDTPTNVPQTRGQNPDNAHQGADQGKAVTSSPNMPDQDARQKDDHGREGGGRSKPAAIETASQPGGTDGYANADARSGSTSQGVGSRGGSYNDEYSNSPQADAAGKASADSSSAGTASGLVNTGPDQQHADKQARDRQKDGPDSGGASTGRGPGDTSERV